jgi:hypothetical protein
MADAFLAQPGGPPQTIFTTRTGWVACRDRVGNGPNRTVSANGLAISGVKYSGATASFTL